MAPAPDATSTARSASPAPAWLLRLPLRVVLGTHDSDPTPPADPPPADPPPAADPPADPPADPAPEGDKPLGPAGEKALREMKERARKAEADARANAAAAKRLREIEDAQKSETERLTEAAQRAQARAAAAEQRAVASEIRALASTGFADPTDAVESLGGNVAQYVDESGVVDEAAIREALEALLERKPHWRKPAPAPVPGTPPPPAPPRPDPSQGSRTPPPPVNFATDPAALKAEAAKFGIRLK